MKLYTEEQVRLLLDLAKLKVNNDEKYSIDELLDALTPIELPSDEEIRNAANSQSHYEGAMWFKYKILNQNK